MDNPAHDREHVSPQTGDFDSIDVGEGTRIATELGAQSAL